MHSEGFADTTVRFTMPASVALDPKGFLGALEDIAERLGCRRCFSGVDCLFQLEKDFHYDGGRFLPTDPVPWRRLPTVDVAMPEEALSDIDGIRKVAEIAFGKLGCLPCTSGFDVLFRNTLRTLVINQKFNAQTYGQGF